MLASKSNCHECGFVLWPVSNASNYVSGLNGLSMLKDGNLRDGNEIMTLYTPLF